MPELPLLPPVAGQPLSVVLLARNDAPHLEGVVSSWLAYLNGLGRDFEVILVEDGSRDDTARRADRLAGRSPRVEMIGHAAPQGDGACLREAFARARHPLLFYTRCQPPYRPADLNRLLVEPRCTRPDEKATCPEIDLVHLSTGYRAWRPVPAALRLAGSLWRAVCRTLFSVVPQPLPGWLGWRQHLGGVLLRQLLGVHSRDPFCPFRLFRRDILRRIPLQSDGPFVHVEILAKANFLELLLGEDLPLGERRKPSAQGPDLAVDGPFSQLRADFLRVLSRPDFGPVEVPGWREGERFLSPSGA